MKIAPGHFAKVMHDCKPATVLIERLTFHEGKLTEVFCVALNRMWAKGFYPNQILEVTENPDAEKYLKQQQEAHKRVTRYIKGDKPQTKIIPNPYEDGYLNNFD